MPWQLWGLLVLLGLGCGALGNVWWLQILGHLDASRSALILFLVPIVSTGLAVALLGEKLTSGLVVGGILVIGGVLVVQLMGNGQRSAAPVAPASVETQA